MSKQSSSLLRFIRVLPRGLFLALTMCGLYVIAELIALFGHTSLRDNMRSTFRRWYILPPKTEEEKAERVVANINLRMTLLGFGPIGFIGHMLWRYTVKPMTGHFLDRKLAEVRVVNVAQFSSLNDAEMVIGATSYLDRFLAIALIVKFSGTLSQTQYDDLFEGHGALSGFADKISACGALGLLVGDMQHDFTILRKLRNDYAHTVNPIKLTDPGISNRCRALKMSYDLSADTMTACGSVERQKFLRSVAGNMLHLSVLIQRGIIERQLLQKHFDATNKQTQEAMKQIRANVAAVKPAT